MTLDDLRKIAEAATKGPWAPWPDQDGTPHMNGLLMVGNADAVIPEGETWIEGVDINPIAHVLTPEDREFIATFNPERVLELLARLAAVEKLHTPVEIEPSDTICGHCSFQLPNGKYFGKIVEYPCDTIKAARGE